MTIPEWKNKSEVLGLAHSQQETGLSKKSSGIHLQQVFALLLLSMIILHGLSAYVILASKLKNVTMMAKASVLNEAGDDLFQAVKNYGFERGRTNLVLHHEGDPAEMSGHRIFILEKREQGDKALFDALTLLESDNADDFGKPIRNIRERMDKISVLREDATREMDSPSVQRDMDFPPVLFSAVTGLIGSIEELLVVMSNSIRYTDSGVSHYFSIKHKVLSLRNTAGPEMSILLSNMLSGTRLKPELSEKILELQVVTNHTFKELEYLVTPLEGTEVHSAFSEMRSQYRVYETIRDDIYESGMKGLSYSMSYNSFLDLGVNTLNTIADFMDTVAFQAEGYVDASQIKIRQDIIKQMLLLLGAFILFLIIFLYISRKFILPVQTVTARLLDLGKGESSLTVPYIDRSDEIGELAKAVELFNNTVKERDKSIRQLETVSAERADLIENLQNALEEVKTLKGIIPICSYCKSIRNDQGYYEQLESYISSHSDMDFSHTICPDCLEKYYPDLGKDQK